MITDTQKILAMKGEARYNDLKGEALLKPILESIQDRRTTTFTCARKPDPLYHILKTTSSLQRP